MPELGPAWVVWGKLVVADPASEPGEMFSNETSRGTSESTTRQASEMAVNKTGAGLHTRVACGRLSSRICATRSEMCRTRPTAACASANPRRSRLFSARETRHSA